MPVRETSEKITSRDARSAPDIEQELETEDVEGIFKSYLYLHCFLVDNFGDDFGR